MVLLGQRDKLRPVFGYRLFVGGDNVLDPAEIAIGLMGLGVVGGGVASALLDPESDISRRVGKPVTLKKILVRDGSKPRDPSIPPDLITTNPEDILADPGIQIVAEVIGGDQPATRYLKDALSGGCLLYTSPSPRDRTRSRMPSSA